MSLNMYSIIDYTKSPYVAEMEALKDHQFNGNEVYFDPIALDKNIDDLTQIEGRLLRLIMHMIAYDKNYMGIVDLSDEVIDMFAVGTKFSKPMFYSAIKNLKGNMKDKDTKPVIKQYGKKTRTYWVNPSIICKKSLIDKYLENKGTSATVVVDDEEETDQAETA